MKLNNSDRDAFVNAVMDDVPQVDYSAQARKLVLDAAAAKLPPKVRALWNDKDLRSFVRCDKWVRTPFGLDSVHIPPVEGAVTPQLQSELENLAVLAQEQRTARRELERKVRATIISCSTLNQAKERLPEFEKYLPVDRGSTGTVNLPAVANVVADLTKAGWPKSSKK